MVAVKEPVYEASSSYILINPPAPPTPEDIARDPSLGRINSDNPYTRFADQSVMIEVLASTMASESAQRALLEAGADTSLQGGAHLGVRLLQPDREGHCPGSDSGGGHAVGQAGWQGAHPRA